MLLRDPVYQAPIDLYARTFAGSRLSHRYLDTRFSNAGNGCCMFEQRVPRERNYDPGNSVKHQEAFALLPVARSGAGVWRWLKQPGAIRGRQASQRMELVDLETVE